MSGPRGSDQPDPAALAAQLAARGVVGVAISYVDNSGIARVKTFPVSRLVQAVERGIGMSPVFDVFMFDDAITASARVPAAHNAARRIP